MLLGRVKIIGLFPDPVLSLDLHARNFQRKIFLDDLQIYSEQKGYSSNQIASLSFKLKSLYNLTIHLQNDA